MKLSKTWRDRLTPIVTKIQPAARVAERIATLAVHVQRPTAIGLAGLAATGISALANEIGNPKAPPSYIDTLISRGQLIEAIEGAGGTVTVHRYHDNTENAWCVVHGVQFNIGDRGQLIGTFDPRLTEWLRQAVDRALPSAIEVRQKQDRNGTKHEATPFALSQYNNEQALAIRDATLPLLDGGRCLMLDGKPGVGKTTMAQIIAREAGLGRVVVLENTIVGAVSYGDGSSIAPVGPAVSGNDFRDALAMLSPGVVIVDDVDKVNIPLARLEAIRSSSRLVILTANNGQYDEVLDGALMRAGRVDEVFTIAPAAMERSAPFDRLGDAEWDEVSQWPVAYVNEVRKRLASRPQDVRLDDLRARLTRKTRSGEVLR